MYVGLAEVGERVQQAVCQRSCRTVLSHATYSWWDDTHFTPCHCFSDYMSCNIDFTVICSL